ncbi:MAG: hypothetical protein ACOCSP_00135 [archaeon]
MVELPDVPEGTLHVTEAGTVPAPDWYEDYEGPVEIVTPALSVAIESPAADSVTPVKVSGETAPFPLDPDPWHRYGDVAGKGLDRDTAAKTELTQPDKILFDLGDGFRLYRIEGLHSIAARDDCR